MSAIITLPSWISRGIHKLTTKADDKLDAGDVAMRFALSLRIHDDAEKLRRLAGLLESKVPLEVVPKMKAIRREKDDYKTFGAVLKLINRATDKMGILKGEGMKRNEAYDEFEGGATQRLIAHNNVGLVENAPDPACRVLEEIKDGWGWPLGSGTVKAHFFLHGKALCGKWKSAEFLVYSSERERCATCKRMLIKITEAT